jgi:hypothetical protein
VRFLHQILLWTISYHEKEEENEGERICSNPLICHKSLVHFYSTWFEKSRGWKFCASFEKRTNFRFTVIILFSRQLGLISLSWFSSGLLFCWLDWYSVKKCMFPQQSKGMKGKWEMNGKEKHLQSGIWRLDFNVSKLKDCS